MSPGKLRDVSQRCLNQSRVTCVRVLLAADRGASENSLLAAGGGFVPHFVDAKTQIVQWCYCSFSDVEIDFRFHTRLIAMTH